MIDLRCDGNRRRGLHVGPLCNHLLARVSRDTVGEVQTKCEYCGKLRTWLFSDAVLVST